MPTSSLTNRRLVLYSVLGIIAYSPGLDPACFQSLRTSLDRRWLELYQDAFTHECRRGCAVAKGRNVGI
jgi:hypothetical protein